MNDIKANALNQTIHKDYHRCKMDLPKQSLTGHTVFAVQNNAQCFTAANAKDTYKMHGESNVCAADGTGGAWGNSVYEIKCGEYIIYVIFYNCSRAALLIRLALRSKLLRVGRKCYVCWASDSEYPNY